VRHGQPRPSTWTTGTRRSTGPASARAISARVGYPLLGIATLLGVWWFGGWLIANNPDTSSFAGFAPAPAFARLSELLANGYVWEATAPSLERIGLGLLWAIVIGVPVGVGIGLSAALREISHVPFQFLRMISPLAWMPIAVLAFATWDGAIVFLVAVAAVWPILFSTAQGVRRIDPLWFKVARNLGADGVQMLRRIILPGDRAGHLRRHSSGGGRRVDRAGAGRVPWCDQRPRVRDQRCARHPGVRHAGRDGCRDRRDRLPARWHLCQADQALQLASTGLIALPSQVYRPVSVDGPAGFRHPFC
jgi:ABC-type nitrate/sulfonate/bicarbonate transport system permease component